MMFRYRNIFRHFYLKSTLVILILVYLSMQSYGQDSLYSSRIGSSVRTIEEEIIDLRPHMFIRNIQVNGWYEEYIVDTVNKKLLRVKLFGNFDCDTNVMGHPDHEGNWRFVVNCRKEHFTFFYQDNYLVRVSDNGITTYYLLNEDVFLKPDLLNLNGSENSRWYFMYLMNLSNRFLLHFRKLF